MTDESILIHETGSPIPFTVSNGAGIEKGAVLILTDPMTAATATGDGDEVAGVAAAEKINGDGITKLAVYREGIFKGTAGVAGVTVGKAIQTDVGTSSANRLVDVDAGTVDILGVALETATSGETFLYELKPIHSTVG